MEKKTQGRLLFSIIIIYAILWKIFYLSISKNYNYLIGGIWVIFIILATYWFTKKTDYFEKQKSYKATLEHQAKVLEQTGFFSVIIPLAYILGLVSIGIGIFAFFYDPQDGLKLFTSMSIIGVVVIIIMFFIQRSIKRKTLKEKVSIQKYP